MKLKGAAEKWVSGILGLVCLLLVLNLLRGSWETGGEKPALATARPSTERKVAAPPAGGGKDELARYNPEIKLDLLSDLQSRELPSIERNPFEFPKPKEPPRPVGPTMSQATVTPTPPPTLPIKMIGYTEKPDGVKEGVVSDDEGIYVVHEGETFNKRYKVNKLTSASASIYDEVTKQTVELPIAQ